MPPKPNPEASGGWWSRAWQRVRPGAAAQGAVRGLDEERRSLKAAIQRKRRNDRVRHNELNELRELMRAQRAAAATESAAIGESGVSTQVTQQAVPRSGWPRVGPDNKSRTIEQIARIEAQMAQHWAPQPAESPGLRIGAPGSGRAGPIVSGHLQAHAGGSSGLSIDMVTAEPSLQQAELEAQLAHPALTEAAVRFANGRLDEVRQALEALQAQEVRSPLARATGLLLLDLLWAMGDVEGFEEWAAEWADRFRQPVPRWPALTAGEPPSPLPEVAAPAPAADWRTWTCPPLLDLAAVQRLAESVALPEGAVWLDWSDLVSADVEAAERLAALLEQWADQPLTLRWRAGAVLRRRLKASTPSGRRENHPVWWRLRLAALRLMGRRDEFDLVALDFCVTYGDLPPDWRDPVASVEVAEALPPATAVAVAPVSPPAQGPATPLDWPEVVSTVAAGESEFPAMATQMADWSVETVRNDAGPVARLEGVLEGDVSLALSALDAALARSAVPGSGASTGGLAQVLVIDARRLRRIDFAAAGALLQWLLAERGRGVRVEFQGVSHLLAVLFHVVGIDEAAIVRLRQY